MKTLLILFCTGLSVASLAQNVVQGEYFIDTDLGYGNNTPVTFTPSADGIFQLSVPVSSYPPGYHKLYIRTKDSDGKWSFTSRRNIEVLASEAKITTAKGEYFIDTDPGFGMGLPITIATPDSIILQNFAAATTGLSEGYHKLYGRLTDNVGRWSITFRRNLEIYKDDNNKVVSGEYFFTTDEGFGDCTPVTFAVPAADGSFTFNIPRSSIPQGADKLFVRVHDDIESRWSLTQMLGNIVNPLPLTLLNLTAIKENDTALVDWQTADELNTSHFNIQRSTDGVRFITVGTMSAKAGSAQNNYTYANEVAGMAPGKVYYRLQMVDKDGSFTYSKIVYITIVNGVRITIHPNPARGYFIIGNYESIDIKNARVLVTDLTGRTFISQKFHNATQQKINIAPLSKGLYMVSVITPGNVQTQKLVVE